MSERLSGKLLRSYRMLGSLTPLPVDCGQLCGAVCCKGDEYGMLLFPGEAHMLSLVPEFHVTKIRYMDGHAWLLSCPGRCDRQLRPLACRVFPLAPHIEETGRISALPDPRARRMCPLAGGEHLDPRFRRAVGRVFDYLSRDPKLYEFMARLSRELDELRRLYPV